MNTNYRNLKIDFKYSGKKFQLAPYNTHTEKEILLLENYEIQNMDVVLELLGISKNVISELSEDEKKVLLFKFREISIGDEIPIKYKCSCGFVNETSISIDNLVQDSNIQNPRLKDAFTHLTKENFQEFLNEDVNELDVLEFDELYKEAQKSVTKFNFIKSVKCLHCQKETKYNISNNVLSHMSEDTIVSLYQAYTDLVFFGKYTKQDIDSLYPFERTILIGLLKKTREELSK